MAVGAERYSLARGYIAAAAAVAVAVMVRLSLEGEWVRVPPLSYFAAVTVAAWFGGRGPAVAAAMASAAAMAVLSQSPLWTNLPSLFGIALLVVSGVALAALANAVQSARRHADDNAAAALRRGAELERQMADRTHAESALRDQYRLTQSITDNATAALCMTDALGRCTYMNPAAQELLGYSFMQLRGRVLHDVLHAAHAEGDGDCPLNSGAPRRALRAHADAIRRADGSTIATLCAVTPILRDGEPIGSVVELRDVSAEQRAAQDREALLEVTEQARANAETASRSKDEFLAILSHELRSPLQAMVGWLAALRLHPEDPAMVGRATEALDRSLRMQGDLVNDLLDVSRIISGKLTLERSWVDLGLIAANGVDLARPAAAAKGLDLRFEPPAEAVLLIGDAARLQQLITNLLSNAIKFTPPGGRIDVHVDAHDGSGEMVVSDTGEGIAADVLPHIFERFRQADSRSTRVHGGLGLGLAIVRHLAEAHGGVVEAHSAGVGHGSAFRIRLPLAADGAHPGPTPSEAAEAPQIHGLHVLLVDDDVESAEPLALALSHNGARVAVAASVAEALTCLEREAFDIIVSDVGMPGESGLSLARTLRAREAGRAERLPAIALTGFASLEDRARAFAAGFDDHLAKPVDIAVLMARLRRLAPRSGADAQ
ncbi:MAG: ATP-binding protein [bacterium]